MFNFGQKLSTLSSSFTGRLWQRLSERKPRMLISQELLGKLQGGSYVTFPQKEGSRVSVPEAEILSGRWVRVLQGRDLTQAGAGTLPLNVPSQVGRNPERGCLCRSMGMGPEVPECSPRDHDQASTQPTRDLILTNQWEKLFQNMHEDQRPDPRNHLNTAWE